MDILEDMSGVNVEDELKGRLGIFNAMDYTKKWTLEALKFPPKLSCKSLTHSMAFK